MKHVIQINPYIMAFIIIICQTRLSFAQNNTFPASGNVGIGTISPTSPLSISHSDTASDVQMDIFNPVNGVGQVAGLRFHTASGWNVMLRTNQGNAWMELTNNVGLWFHRWYGGNYYTKGSIGIGTENTGSYKLAVDGMAKAKEMVVTNNANDWPDYVFGKDYDLPNLEKLKSFVKKNRHLPGIPDRGKIIKTGQNLGLVQTGLLKKIEELTLIVIKQNETLKKQQNEIEGLKKSLKDHGWN